MEFSWDLPFTINPFKVICNSVYHDLILWVRLQLYSNSKNIYLCICSQIQHLYFRYESQYNKILVYLSKRYWSLQLNVTTSLHFLDCVFINLSVYLRTLQGLQNLHDQTPVSVVFGSPNHLHQVIVKSLPSPPNSS